MKFSIVVPTLNEEKYIGKLLEALSKQTLKGFEVIVVDGHSPDKTVEEVYKYKDKLDVQVVYSDIRNVSYQRNLGATNAKYNDIIFFDADVVPPSTFLQKLSVKIFKKSLDASTSWNKPISKKWVDKLLYGAFNVLYLEAFKKVSPGAIGTFIYVKKSVFEAVGGFEKSVCLGEDFDLIRRIHKAGYNFDVLRTPAIPFSVRCLNEEGRRNFIKKQIRAGIYYHTKGSIRDSSLFKHTFGEHNA